MVIFLQQIEFIVVIWRGYVGKEVWNFGVIKVMF